MYFDVDDRLRWALRVLAADRDAISVAHLVKDILEERLAEQLAEYDRRAAKGELPKREKSNRGRPRKPKSDS